MITLIPNSLHSFNLASIQGAHELVTPVSQVGRLTVTDDVSFLLAPHLLTQPDMMGFFTVAHQEGYTIRAVVGGGSTDDLRRASSAWAFIPMPFIERISLDALVDEQRQQQSAIASKNSVVQPTMRALRAVAAGRSSAKPALDVLDVGDSQVATSRSAADSDESDESEA